MIGGQIMIQANVKYRNVLIMKIFIIVIYIIFFTFSCEENYSYQVVFKLQNYTERHYDLYNPILNTFKMDSLHREDHPNYYYFDVYYNEDTLKFFFYRSESYGYLHQIFYNDVGLIDKIKIFPVLGNNIDKNAPIMISKYFYENKKLRIIKNMLSNELIIIDNSDASIYKGIIDTSERFYSFRVKCDEYFKKHLF